MKNKSQKLTSVLLCLFLVISSLSMLSCNNSAPGETTPETTPAATAKAPETTADVSTSEIPETTADVSTSERPETTADVSTSERPETTPETTPAESSEAIAPTSTETTIETAEPESSAVLTEPETEPETTPEETTAEPETAPETAPETEPETAPEESEPAETVSPESGPADITDAASHGLRSALSVIAFFENRTSASIGSGVIYKLDPETGSAFIITNYHVVYNKLKNATTTFCEDVVVLLYGLEYENYAITATVVGGSAHYDLAVLRVENSELLKACAESGSAKAATLASSDRLIPGQTAIAVGNAESDGISVTTGIVSVDSEQISFSSLNGLESLSIRVFRLDTAVNLGNSGGGVYNSNGELIGIVNAKIKSAEVENIGYAIPVNVARAIADNVIYYCYGTDCESAMRSMLGISVTLSSVSTEFDESLGAITVTQEVSVVDVSEGGLAENLLMVDDIIVSLSLNGKTTVVTRQHHLLDTMLDARVGDTVEMTVLRGEELVTVGIEITEDCLIAY